MPRTFFSLAFGSGRGIDSAGDFALGEIGFLSWPEKHEEEYSEKNRFSQWR
jgi:hypothetical protein